MTPDAPAAAAPPPPPPPPQAILKVLALHGFSQDAHTFRGKLGAVRKALKSTCELTFLNAPHSVEGAFDDDAGADSSASAPSTSQSRAWFTSGENARCGARKASDEGWTRPAMSTSYVGFEETVALARDALAANGGEFDGILGFSQGSTAAVALLAAIPELRRAKFVALVAGFSPRDEDMLASIRNAAPFTTPSLHIHGDADALVTRERVCELAKFFNAPEFFFHEGAHGVPTSAAKRLKQFVAASSQTIAR